MPLDQEHGEHLDGLPPSAKFVIIEPRLIAELTNLRTPFTTKKKFQSTSKLNDSTRPIFDDAVEHALSAFKNAGALFPVRFSEDDVLVQVYPAVDKVAIIFQRQIANETKYVTRVYDLPPPVTQALLEASGQKPSQH